MARNIASVLCGYGVTMIVQIILPVVLAAIMFSLGLGLRFADFWRIATQPRAFAVGAFNQMVIVPLVAFCIAMVFALPAELALGVMILASCPGGILSNSACRYAEGGIVKLFELGSNGPDEDKSGGHFSSVVCPQAECVSPRVAV